MRLILGIIFLLLSVGVSVYLTQKTRKRTEFMEDLSSFHASMTAAATLYKCSILQVIRNTTCRADFATYLKQIEQSLQKGCANLPETSILEREKNREIKEYFENVCKVGEQQREDFFSHYQQIFESWKTSARENYEKCRKTYVKLGFLFGCILLIIVV